MLCPACQHDNPPHVYYCEQCRQLLPSPMWEPVATISTAPPPNYSAPLPVPTPHSAPVNAFTFPSSAALCWLGIIVIGFVFLFRLASRKPNPSVPEYNTYWRMVEESEKKTAKARQEAMMTALPPSQSPMQSNNPVRRQMRASDLYAATLSRDGNMVAGITVKNKIGLWDTNSGQIRRNCVLPTSAPSTPIGDPVRIASQLPRTESSPAMFKAPVFSPDGAVLACGMVNNIALWETRTGKFQGYLTGRIWDIESLAFSADGRSLISGGSGTETDRSFNEVWDVRARKVIQTQEELNDSSDGYVLSVAASPDGRLYARGGNAGTITVWDARTGVVQWGVSEQSSELNTLLFSPDSQHLISGDSYSTIEWDTKKGASHRILARYQTEFSTAATAAYSPDGQWLAIIKDWRELALCGFSSNALLNLDWTRRFPMEDGRTLAVAFSSDGTRLQCVLSSGELAIWRFKKPLLRKTRNIEAKNQ